jgi:maltose-binding protein MalE
MKSRNIFYSLATLMMLLLTACNSEAQNTKQTSTATTDAKIEVIQFHSEHRCMTCNKIETLTKETLKAYPNISFSLVNVDDKKNEKKAEQFEATGTALFLYNPKTGKKKDLTDFAFMNAGNKEKFIEGLKKEIDLFLKS